MRGIADTLWVALLRFADAVEDEAAVLRAADDKSGALRVLAVAKRIRRQAKMVHAQRGDGAWRDRRPTVFTPDFCEPPSVAAALRAAILTATAATVQATLAALRATQQPRTSADRVLADVTAADAIAALRRQDALWERFFNTRHHDPVDDLL